MMASLVPCVDCGHSVSRKAEACPSCGRVLKRRAGTSTLSLLDTAALVLLCLFLVPLALGLLGLAIAEIPRGLELLSRLF